MAVLAGECFFESLTPYMPFREALRSGGLDGSIGEAFRECHEHVIGNRTVRRLKTPVVESFPELHEGIRHEVREVHAAHVANLANNFPLPVHPRKRTTFRSRPVSP